MKLEDYHKIDQAISECNIYYDNINIAYIARQHYITLLRNKQNKGNRPVNINKQVVIRLLKGFITTFLLLFSKKKYWVFSNAERRKKINNYYLDRVASIVSEYDPDTLFIENPVLTNHKKPTKDIILSDAVFYFFSLLFSKIYYRRSRLKVDDKYLQMGKDKNLPLNLAPIIKRFIGQYKFMSFYLKYFHKPQVVFSVYPGGYLGYNYSFKKHNIPIIELQHGVIYPLHFSYNTILHEESKLFKPDYIFTYGEKDQECLINLGYLGKDRIYVVGSYGLQKAKDISYNIQGYLNSLISKDKITITFIATANDILELYDFCLEFEKKVSDNYQLLLLPRNPANLLSTPSVKVLAVDKTNIFEIYKISTFVITKASTAALEALFMGIPVFIYETENNKSLFKINYSYVKSLNYFQSLEDLLLALTDNKFQQPTSEDINKIYYTNVHSNFSRALNEITNVSKENIE